MIDGIIRGTKDSRKIQTGTLPPTWEEFRAMLMDGLPIDLMINESGWTRLGTLLDKANLLSDPTASLYGLPNPTVNDLLGVLSGAAMIKEVGGEPIRTPVALSSVPDGAIIKIPVNGTLTDFYLVQQNYESPGNTLLVTKNHYTTGRWGASGAIYNGSDADVACSTFLNALPADIRNTILNVTIESMGATIQRKAFLLSATEWGNVVAATPSQYVEGTQLTSSALSVIRMPSSINLWSRSQVNNTTAIAYMVSGIYQGQGGPVVKTETAHGIRPAFCLPNTFNVYLENGVYYIDQTYRNYSLAAATVLGNIIGGFTRIETGEYTGTGTYGAGNPNVLTFGFEPKIVIIVMNGGGTGSGGNLFVRGQATAQWFGNASGGLYIALSWVGNILTWYAHTQNINGTGQLNTSGTTYYYIAIG